MAIETERKFLVDLSRLDLSGARSSKYTQGYLSIEPVVRVRAGDTEAWLTIKAAHQGISRHEYEYSIPLLDAMDLLRICGDRVLDKTRYDVEYAGRDWEVDIFHGANDGLVVAELELAGEDDVFRLPDWVTAEVTSDPRYSNSYLVQIPFSHWA
jgi:CYTH domain-containing protein